jgi:hypothetical protein
VSATAEDAAAFVARRAEQLRIDTAAWHHVAEVLRFSPAVVADLSLGLLLDADGRRWLAYPYRRAGVWTSVNCRSLDGEKAFLKFALPLTDPPLLWDVGMPHTYRVDALADGGAAIVTEGERDAAAALTMGLEVPGRVAVVALRTDPRPFMGQRAVWLAFDNDAAGDDATVRVAGPWMRALGVPCRRFRLPRHKDLGDALSDLGPETARAEVLAAIARSEPVDCGGSEVAASCSTPAT